MKYDPDAEEQKQFLEDLILLKAKAYHSMSIVDTQWVQCVFLYANPRLPFPTREKMRNIHIPRMVEKVKTLYITTNLEGSPTVSLILDLCMSCGHEDVFSIIFHYISVNWQSLSKSIGLV